jgi:hypothetical protein
LGKIFKEPFLSYSNSSFNSNSPSKIDFAVYLAIKEASIDTKKFSTLNKWFDFMKKYKISDMKRLVKSVEMFLIFKKDFNFSWRTPMRKSNV